MKFFRFYLLFCLCLLIAPTLAQAQDMVLVSRDKTPLQLNEIPQDIRENVESKLTSGYVVNLEAGETIPQDADYRVIKPGTVQALDVTTDPYFYQQWNLKTLHADWIQSANQLGSGIVVAVVDSGLKANHIDTPALKYSTDPTDPLVQTLGWNFIDDNNNTDDTLGHGTSVASIIASPLNGQGIQGLSPAVKILPIKVIGGENIGTTADVAAGIQYAADHGAHVINISLGGTGDPGNIMGQAIDYARNKGSLVVCASGNSGTSPVAFPGRTSSCLTVGAIDQDTGIRASFSQYGNDLDLIAPGTNIPIATINTASAWGRGEGTSFAAPHVSATAALLYAQGLPLAQVEQKIITTASDLGTAGWDEHTGFGALNAVGALGVTEPVQTGGVTTPEPDTIDPEPDTIDPDTNALDPDTNTDEPISQENPVQPCWNGRVYTTVGKSVQLPLDCGGQVYTHSLSHGTLNATTFSPPKFWTGIATLRYRPLQGTTFYTVTIHVTKANSKLTVKIKPTKACLNLHVSHTAPFGKGRVQLIIEYKVGKKWKRQTKATLNVTKQASTQCLKKPRLKGLYRMKATLLATSYTTAATATSQFRL